MFGSTGATGAFGAPAPTFGKGPGGFGTATNTSTNTMGQVSRGGFGATTGFGAPSTAPTASAPAFGAAPTGGLGGFGAQQQPQQQQNSSTGFGAPSAQPGGFGFNGQAAPQRSSFGFSGAQPQQPQQPMGFGFNAQSAAAAPQRQGGYGFPQPQPQMAQQQPAVTLQDFTRQSALANYLVQLDEAYSALSPKCHFTSFVYNSCGPGQAMDAIQKERYTAYLSGGGCSDETYVRALQKNPAPGRLYPSPLHFTQELLQRTERQTAAVAVLRRRVEELMQDVDAVAAMDAVNVQQQREVEQEEGMLQHRWYALLRKMELLRRHSVPYGEESLLSNRVEHLRHQLRAPGQFAELLAELRPFLGEEASRVAMMTQQCAKDATKSSTRSAVSPVPGSSAPSGGARGGGWTNGAGRPLLRSEVDSYMLKDWVEFARHMQQGIETLDALLKTDLKEMRAVRQRVEFA